MDYYKVKIEDVYLTSDGTINGRPCRVNIPFPKLQLDYRHNVVIPIEGEPVTQLLENLIGDIFRMEIFQLNKTEFDDIIDIINTTPKVNITLTDGIYGDIDLLCRYVDVEHSGRFIGMRLPEVTFTWAICEVL